MSRMSRLRKGATIVESVLVLPVILLLIIGIMQLSIFYSDSLHLNYAAYQISRASFFVESVDDIIGYQLMDNSVLPSAVIESGYPFEKDGLVYHAFDVEYTSPVILPVNYKDSEGNPIFPPEGLRLHARGFCPMLKTEE